jgi:hypothetical protein
MSRYLSVGLAWDRQPTVPSHRLMVNPTNRRTLNESGLSSGRVTNNVVDDSLVRFIARPWAFYPEMPKPPTGATA